VDRDAARQILSELSEGNATGYFATGCAMCPIAAVYNVNERSLRVRHGYTDSVREGTIRGGEEGNGYMGVSAKEREREREIER